MNKKKRNLTSFPPLKPNGLTVVLRLYITGSTQRSINAVKNLKKFCDTHLRDHVDLEIVDIYQQPASAGKAQIIAAPTLVKNSPKPVERFIGDLSNVDLLLQHLKPSANRRPGSGE